jgi:hypothetical protein
VVVNVPGWYVPAASAVDPTDTLKVLPLRLVTEKAEPLDSATAPVQPVGATVQLKTTVPAGTGATSESPLTCVQVIEVDGADVTVMLGRVSVAAIAAIGSNANAAAANHTKRFFMEKLLSITGKDVNDISEND